MPPNGTALGALHNYVCNGGLGDYVPMNINLGLFPRVAKKRGQSKADKKKRQCDIARENFENYMSTL